MDGAVCVPPPPATLQTHYEELLRLVAEVGKDVKPAYTNSKISADRLKRSKPQWKECVSIALSQILL